MSIYGPRSELDLVAVKRDGDALDVLARREGDELAEDVMVLLAALTADVDAGLADLLATPMQVPLRSAATGEIPNLSDAARRRTARVVAATLIVGGLVSVSGVSAAVTGDPFTPYRSVISTVSGDGEPRAEPSSIEDEAVQQRILSIDAAIDAGQLGRAQEGIERLRATLDDKPRAAQRSVLARLSALEAKLARAEVEKSNKADVRRPTVPVATDGSTSDPGAPSGLVKKPVDKPKPQPKGDDGDKAKPQATPRASAGSTSRPRQRAADELAPDADGTAKGATAARD
jgi:hypothetical protein